MYFVYFLRSESNPDETYVGSSNNLERRIKEHNEGEGRAHTRRYRPWKIEAFILADTREAAEEVERYFKTPSGKEKFANFAESNPEHPNPIEGFFDAQDVGRKFGRSRFEIASNRIVSVKICEG